MNKPLRILNFMVKDILKVKKYVFIMSAIGFSCFFMVVSSGYNEGMKYQIDRLMRESVSGDYTVVSAGLDVGAEVTPVQVPWDSLITDDGSMESRLRAVNGVDDVLKHLVVYGNVMGADESANDFAYVIGCDLEREAKHAFVSMIKIDAIDKTGDAIYVSKKLSDTLAIKPGDTMYLFLVGKEGFPIPCRFKLGGVFRGRGFPAVSEKLIYMDYSLLKRSLRLEEDAYSSVLVFASAPGKSLHGDLQKAVGSGAKVVDSSVSGAFYRQICNAISFFSVLFNFLMYMTIFLFVYSILIISISNKRKEIGTMNALGIDKRSIFWLLAGEGFLIGLLPATIGSALGEIVLHGIARIGIPAVSEAMQYMFASDVLYFRVNYRILIYSVIVIALISFAAAILPVRKALSLDPVEALKEDR